jgi:hypothetical protein
MNQNLPILWAETLPSVELEQAKQGWQQLLDELQGCLKQRSVTCTDSVLAKMAQFIEVNKHLISPDSYRIIMDILNRVVQTVWSRDFINCSFQELTMRGY